MHENLVSTNEVAFVHAALKDKVRIQNRKFNEFRALSIIKGSHSGTVEVTLGETRYNYFLIIKSGCYCNVRNNKAISR